MRTIDCSTRITGINTRLRNSARAKSRLICKRPKLIRGNRN